VFDYCAEEVEQIRSQLAAQTIPLTCPACHATLLVDGRLELEQDPLVVWVVACSRCKRNLVLREGPHEPVRVAVLGRLVESDRRGRRDVRGAAGGLFFSTVLQTAVIGAAVMATVGVAARDAPVAVDTVMLALDDPTQQAEAEPEPQDAPPIVTTLSAPKGFQVLEAPIDIPTTIPPVDLTQRFDPRDYSGRGTEGGVFAGVEGGTPTVDLDQVFDAVAVEELPEQIYAPPPTYPSALRRANIEGYVEVEYVVRADGTVDPATVTIVESSHRQFEQPAVNAVKQARFRPGRMRGKPVSVLIRQRFNFSMAVGG
jgi:protein TonB